MASNTYLNNLNLSDINDVFTKGSFMLLENPNATRQYIDDYFASNNIDIVPDIEASNMDFLIECAINNLGITSTLKEFLAYELKNKILVEIPIETTIQPRNIGIIY